MYLQRRKLFNSICAVKALEVQTRLMKVFKTALVTDRDASDT